MSGLLRINQGILCIIILALPFITGCSNSTEQYKSPSGYDLTSPEIVKLPLELDEISGIVYFAPDTSLFAIDDEKGWLYKISLRNPANIQRWQFSNTADYEDIALIDTTFFVLNSDGSMAVFRFYAADSLHIKEYPYVGSKGDEYEILYYDPQLKKLILVCKHCDADKKSFNSTFLIDPATVEYSPGFKIDAERIASMMGEEKINFKPSAAEIHPRTGELYIISAVNEVLVVASPNGEAKEIFKLDPKLYKQPEGLCFTPAGDLIISNEAADIGVANLLIYRYNQVTKQ